MFIVINNLILLFIFYKLQQDKRLSPALLRRLPFRVSRGSTLIFNEILNIRKTAYLEASRAHCKLVVFSMHKLAAIMSHHLMPIGFSAV